MITLKDLGFEFGGDWLYRNINWQIKEGDRLGLVGRNGSGKSTLLRLLVGQYTPSEGEIQKSNRLKIGFLNQDLLSFQTTDSILNVTLGAFAELHTLQEEIQETLRAFETNPTDELLHSLSEKQTYFETAGGYTMEARAREILAGLGFKDEEQTNPYNSFSGGWRMRGMLAKILLQEPDLLLLDEPTNHLDLPAIEWVEGYIKKFRGAYIVVSHDRYFLDKTSEEIVEISRASLHTYTGNFSNFIVEKASRAELYRASYQNQQKEIEHLEKFVERFRAKATKAKQAQSRVKMLEKMDKMEAPEDDAPTVVFRFVCGSKSGIDVLALKDVEKQFAPKTILKNAEAVIRRGDKIGLIGANGLGKSTLLRIIAGTESFTGDRKVGHNVTPTFYAQHQIEALRLDNTILEEMQYHSAEKNETYLRNLLGCFLFSGDDVYKKIKVLSGGERARVALARTLLSEANFLLLDEPTNHLDMQSTEILVEALKQYEGTFVVVSHDRYFLSLITNKTWYIEDLQIKEYPGGFDEYEIWKEERSRVQKNQSSETNAAKAQTKTTPAAQSPDHKQKRRLQNEVKSLEQKISNLEAEILTLENYMASEAAISDYKATQDATSKRQKKQDELDSTYQKWEELAAALEKQS